ncbi:hypothetical protein D3C76_1597710 [compost metagenome]
MHALFGDLTNITEAEHLEAAGIGEDRAFPLHEIMQIAVQFHHFLAWAQPQVEGVTEDNLCASGFNFFRRHPFYGAVGADRHKCWRFYHAAIKHQAATASASVGGIEFKFHFFSRVRKTVRRVNQA